MREVSRVATAEVDGRRRDGGGFFGPDRARPEEGATVSDTEQTPFYGPESELILRGRSLSKWWNEHPPSVEAEGIPRRYQAWWRDAFRALEMGGGILSAAQKGRIWESLVFWWERSYDWWRENEADVRPPPMDVRQGIAPRGDADADMVDPRMPTEAEAKGRGKRIGTFPLVAAGVIGLALLWAARKK